MKNYIMTVKIPIKEVPDDVTIQEVKVKSQIWLSEKIPDAVVTDFREEAP